MDEDILLISMVGRVGVATLNRPKILNVIDIELIGALSRCLEVWANASDIRAVLVRGAGDRAFCAGGDVRAVFEHRGDDDFMHKVYRVEYLLDEMTSCYPKPYVALMSGIVMGGGCGISVHGSHRIVTDTTVMAMPECKIGLFPDIGASYFLARCPGQLGMYAGLTGARFGAADSLYLKLADYFVKSNQVEKIIPAINASDNVSDAIRSVATDADEPPIAARQQQIDRIFGHQSVREIVRALIEEPGEWAREAYLSITTASPISIELTFRNIREAASKSLRECLITDFRIAQRLMHRPDYFEGVRALIIDKDQKPKWAVATFDAVDPADIDTYFAPLEESDLRFSDRED
jgi:enoyl-CoA hydratase